ncbi:MAG: FGGY-family carbohydrate kinase [Geminicoccaceae bacterium]
MASSVEAGDLQTRPHARIVLDVGKTTLKLVAVAPDGRFLTSRTAPNEPSVRGLYPSLDVEHVWRWLMAALADLGERYRIDAIVPCAYGSTAALIDDHDLVTPIMDYEAIPPPEIAAAYAAEAPPFDECLCPINPMALTLGRQLFWIEQVLPLAFERARWILPHAQYWTWRLCGAVVSEITSMGAQTQLIDPRNGNPSSLALAKSWNEKFPDRTKATEVAGRLRPEIVDTCQLSEDAPVLVGIHDSNANYARYLAAVLDDITLISSGTWLILFNPAAGLDRLVPDRDTCTNNDLEGRPVACARFMGGREYALVAGEAGLDATPTSADIQAVIDDGLMVLPSFSDSGGPFPGTGGRGTIDPKILAMGASGRAAAAVLYTALVTDTCLELLASKGEIIVDGSFADNALFLGLLKTLREDQPVWASRERHGTAIGAAGLVDWDCRDALVPLDLEAVTALRLTGLERYREKWQQAVRVHGQSAASD